MDLRQPMNVTVAVSTTLSALGRFTEALALLEEGVTITAEVGLPTFWLDSNLGLLAEMHLGWYEDAGARGQANLKAGQDLGSPSLLAMPRLLLGCVALAREEIDEALGLLRKCAAVFREGRVRYELSIALAILGMAAVGRGDRTQAVQVLREALQIVDETGSFLALGWVIPGVVSLLLDQGQAEKAVELYAMASSRYPFVRASRWFEDVIGQHVAAAAAALPPAVIEAAEARGRAREEAETVTELLVALKAEGAA
jgi:ATP/maltotriose-dependent transcriptional regulator MalT